MNTLIYGSVYNTYDMNTKNRFDIEIAEFSKDIDDNLVFESQDIRSILITKHEGKLEIVWFDQKGNGHHKYMEVN